MDRRSYQSHPDLPARNNPDYDRQYHLKVRKKKLKHNAADFQLKIQRKASKAARAKIHRDSKRTPKYEDSFACCIDARTSRPKQAVLDGTFYQWRSVLAHNSLDRTATSLNTTSSSSSSSREFALFLNDNFRLHNSNNTHFDKQPHMVPWATVKPSTIQGANYGLFADRRFEAGDTVGVYMGGPSPPLTDCQTLHHSDHPYLMSGVADALGGVDSNQPAMLGMHFINDPCFCNTVPNAKHNVAANSDGRIVALRRIQRNQEFFISYNTTLP